MNKVLVLIILAHTGAYFCAKTFRQERAQVKYVNPKYIWNATAYTGRQRRGESYRTNITATTLQPWGNNVTFELSYKPKLSPTPMTLKIKVCDIINLQWMVNFIKQFTDITYSCPIPAGTYKFINLELPPKNFPLPLPKGDLRVDIRYFGTATMEVMLELTALLHVP